MIEKNGNSPGAMPLRFILLGVLIMMSLSSLSQTPENPPRPLTLFVNPALSLNFGSFYQGASGGTITIYPNGLRSSTGSVVLTNMGFSFSPAVFEVDAEPGTIVTLSNGPDVSLTGSNGGFMILHIGSSDPSSPIVTRVKSPDRTEIRIGGVLTVANPLANPPGNYSGTFSVIFIQQ
ncbi:hypothetical protein A0256_01085 [Mucilaginibacter sp. PAMC 26640]|nr:hypothetical protein A0256_01085 [Mucilaginibacter sp. PAMC 26640]